jgi:hypothetical protein
MKPGGLRHEVDFLHRYRLLCLLRRTVTTSTAGSPILLHRISDCASRVHAIDFTPDLRFLLYALKVHTQYPRIWSMAYTPIARAIQSRKEPFQLASRNKLTQILMPSPSFRGMSKVRTLQTEIPCVTIVRFRLGVSPCDGVSEFIPVFPGLQTGYSSLSPACQVSLDVLG